MTDRVEQTMALLRSLADWEPPVRIAAARGAIRGESPGRLELCGRCDGTGRRGGTTFPCTACKGRGSVPVDPQTGHVVTDDVVPIEQLIRRRRDPCATCGGNGLQTASTARDPGPRDVLERDDRGHYRWAREDRPPCPACAGTGTREAVEMARVARAGVELDVGGDPLGVAAALDRKQAQFARGSYAALEHRLMLLAAEYPGAARLLERHVVHPIGAVVSPVIAGRIEWAVEWVAAGMPYPIVVPEEALRWRPAVKVAVWRGRSGRHKSLRDGRDEELQVSAAEHPVAWLAETFGLTERHVRRILREARERPAVASGPAAA